MAWTAANPVSIGNATKKSHYDSVWDNVQFISTNVMPAATKAWFYQNVAPVGWTIDGTPADAILAVKGGTQAYNAAGGTQAGTWTQPDHLHSTANFTLTATESPAHTHDLLMYQSTGGGDAAANAQQVSSVSATSTSFGGGGAHSHGNTGNSATAATWRPLAQLGVICSKDAYA